MSARLKMQMRCTIQRNAAATDDWGGTGAPGWADHLTELPCYAWERSGGGEVMDNAVVVISNLHVLFPVGSDVTESDRIVEITDRQGDVKWPGPMQIRAVDRMPNCLDATVVTTL